MKPSIEIENSQDKKSYILKYNGEVLKGTEILKDAIRDLGSMISYRGDCGFISEQFLEILDDIIYQQKEGTPKPIDTKDLVYLNGADGKTIYNFILSDVRKWEILSRNQHLSTEQYKKLSDRIDELTENESDPQKEL